jgi:hypothetical protein
MLLGFHIYVLLIAIGSAITVPHFVVVSKRNSSCLVFYSSRPIIKRTFMTEPKVQPIYKGGLASAEIRRAEISSQTETI